MSERTLAILLTLVIFLLMLAWIPLLDLVVRMVHRQRQARLHKASLNQMEADLRTLYPDGPWINLATQTANEHER